MARAAPPAEVFAAVAAEAGQLMGCESTMLCRYDPDGEATVIGAWSANRRQVARSVGTRTPVEGVLRVRIDDDGCGGANPAEGSGLVGLEDRFEALGGQLWLASPAGAGTTVQAALPLH